jgi:hypothetical protein
VGKDSQFVRELWRIADLYAARIVARRQLGLPLVPQPPVSSKHDTIRIPIISCFSELVVIDAELGREDHSSIPRNYNLEGAGTTCKSWPRNQIELVVKAKKKNMTR